MRVEDILEKLEAVTGAAPQWSARCPAHDDRHASLSVSIGDDERVLLSCWAGCSVQEVMHALGLAVSDLFTANGETRAPWGNGSLGKAETDFLPDPADLERYALALQQDTGRLESIFRLKGWRPDVLAAAEVGLRGDRLAIPVRAADHTLVNVLRYWPAHQPKMLALRGHPRAPLLLLVDDDGPVWIVEGETDALSMANLGLNVIGAPGASAKARVDWLASVHKRTVFVCFDVDEPGRRAAVRWAAAAQEAGASEVRIVALEGPTGYDVGDLVSDRRDEPEKARAALLELAEAAPVFEAVRTVEVPATARAREAEDIIDAAAPGDMILRPLSSVQAERVHMLWRGRIPRGRIGIVCGMPGLGKSTLTALMIADVTKTGGRVLVASAEDDPHTATLPRAIAAGADIGLVDLISTRASKGETSLVLPRDLDSLGARMNDAAMLIIDPLSAHLGDNVNAWSEQSVRSLVMAPLAWHARRTDCAVPLIMHLNKSAVGDPLARISGSGGFAGAARFVLLLGQHPDDIGLESRERRVALAHVKASESAVMPTMIFRRGMVGVDVGKGETSAIPVLELIDDASTVSPEAVLEIPGDSEEVSAYSQAIDYLRYELAAGPRPAKHLVSTARERGDFSERTLRKAKHALKVASKKELDGWWWELP